MAQRFEYIDKNGVRREIPSMRAKAQVESQAFAAGVDEAIHGIMASRGINYLDAFEALASERPEIFREV